jgi:hypothetical protein
MKIKKVCIVGYGPHVEKTIIPSLSLKKKNIKIISSKSKVKNFDVFPNIKTALKKINKDHVIFNATPPKVHFETSKLILNMGFNLIIEKPICLNTKQLTQLKMLSEKQGLFIFENMMYFYSKQFSIFEKYILDKSKINSIKLNFFIPNFNKDSFRSNTSLNSSLLYDVGCYPFSLISYLGFEMKDFNIIYKFKNKILNYLKIDFTSKKIKFFVKIGFFYNYENFLELIYSDKTKVRFNYFFYGKKMKKKNEITLPNLKKKIFIVNDYNVFKKIFNFDIKKIDCLSKKQTNNNYIYLKMLNRIKKNIKQ